MAEKIPSTTSRNLRRLKAGERLAESVLAALSTGETSVSASDRLGFADQLLYDTPDYAQAATYLSVLGVAIEARRYKKKIVVSTQPTIMSRLQVYDVIDVVDHANGGPPPDNEDTWERGELVKILYPPEERQAR